jgi:hypothetical protein
MGEGNLSSLAQPLLDAEPIRRASSPAAKRRRVLLSDARSNGKHLRVTWHRERGLFVVSIWNDDVCTGTVQVPVANAPELISLLVDGLAQQPVHPSTTQRPPDSPVKAVLGRVRRWLRRGTRPERPSATALATVQKLHR